MLDSFSHIPILRSMTKYWDARRIRRRREGRETREREAFVSAVAGQRESRTKAKTYSSGDDAKNMSLMLDALGVPMRRQMVERLQRDGAMSLSKLAEPFRIKLPTALEHIRILEQSAIVTTHKQGRVRICVYNPQAFKELAELLVSQAAFWESSFARLERHITNKKK